MALLSETDQLNTGNSPFHILSSLPDEDRYVLITKCPLLVDSTCIGAVKLSQRQG